MGAYTSLNTLCTYLESDVSAEGQAERNFWVSASRPASGVTPPTLISTDNGHDGITLQLTGGQGPIISSQEGCQRPALCP